MSESKIMDAVVILPEAKQELITIANETGLADNTRDHIIESFVAFYSKMKELKEKALSIEVTDIEQKDKMKEARELRLEVKNIRTSANRVREQLKEDSLRYGKTVQSIYNAIEAATKPVEAHLEQQEKFAELQELKRKALLKDTRLSELQMCEIGNLLEFVPVTIDIAALNDEDYLKLFNGAKLQLQARIDAEAKAEAERIEKEKAEAEEHERIRLENERLRKEAEDREKELAAERAKAEAEKKVLEEKARKEAEEREKAEAEKRKLEEAEQKRIADEQAKKESEEKAKAEADRKAAAAPDMEKLNALASMLESIQCPTCSTDNGKKAIEWAMSQISTLATALKVKAGNL